METERGVDSQFKKEAERIVTIYKNRAKKISNGAAVKEFLRFSPQQAKIFDAGFAYYLLYKEGKEAHDLASDPHIQAMSKMKIRGVIARNIFNKDDLNNAAVKKLKTDLDKQIEDRVEKEDPNPQLIVNMANRLSTMYLDCCKRKGDFNYEFRNFLNNKSNPMLARFYSRNS